MDEGEEWILDYKIVDSENKAVQEDFNFSLEECIYNTTEGIYNKREGFIDFSIREALAEEKVGLPTGLERKVFKVTKNSYTEEAFKKQSKIYLKIIPPK